MPKLHHPTVLLILFFLHCQLGCAKRAVPESDRREIQAESNTAVMDEDALRAELDHVLEFTLNQRRLNTDDHDAWQILHGALAFQRDFPVRVGRDGPVKSAVDHILQGGAMDGWDVQVGDVLDPDSGRRGLRALMDAGSKSGQGHHDQWLAVLAQCGLPADQPIRVDHRQFSMSDYVQQVQLDVPRNTEREWSWTIIGLTAYLPTTASWKASDGQSWSIHRLMELETEQDVDESTCGGTHRLIGLAMSLNHHLRQGGSREGPWNTADEKIQRAIELAREYQNPDGTFSTNYFARPGYSPDLADTIRTTGHTLEFLTLAMSNQQLRQQWVTAAVSRLCDVFRKTKDLPLECGALYHAAHGLVLYRQRVFGEHRYKQPDAVSLRGLGRAGTVNIWFGAGIGG